MTKVEDRTVVKLGKEALLADREGLKGLFRGVLQEVLEAEMTEAIGASNVRRQNFWDRRWLKIRESLAPLVCNIMRLADGAASGDWRLSVV